MSASPRHLRCAIYTRKSSEEGLEQDYNSLHAQREACEAYIKSQRHEGWQLIKTAYDDGGISGGTMQRPALQQLLEDIRAKKVDIIVVYKVDRLTRSLADFARMVELFDSHNVSFVSVTQQFNTTSSMGRLTLNVLLSFAQFEREVTGERIRDKIKASKAKGIFMGGRVPLGYRVQDRKLLIREDEADTVRHIFQRYLELGCVSKLRKEMEAQGIRGRPVKQDKGEAGGSVMTHGAIYHLLRNPVYIGKIRHKKTVHDGQHPPLLPYRLWEAVQTLLDSRRNAPKALPAQRKVSETLLIGKVKDETGDVLTPVHTVKNGRRLRYYISWRLKFQADPSGWRLPAAALEEAVVKSVRDTLTDSVAVAAALKSAGIPSTSYLLILNQLKSAAGSLAPDSLLHNVLQTVDLRPGGMTLHMNLESLVNRHGDAKSIPVPMSYPVPLELKRRGVEMRLVLKNGGSSQSQLDPVLVKTVARAVTWFEDLRQGRYQSLNHIADQNSVSKSYVGDLMKLAFLSPKIIEQIVAGRQPDTLVTDHLIKCQDLPLGWQDQADRFSFA